MKERAVSDYGMAIVLVRNVPVEILRTQLYRDQIRLRQGLPIPELEYPDCKKRSKPIAIISKGQSLLYCSKCSEK